MCKLGEEYDEEKKKRCSNVVMCWFRQSPWQKVRQKEDKEEKKVQQHLCTIHAKHTIAMSKNAQPTCNTHGETHDELLGLSGDDDLQQMKPLLPLLSETPPLRMMTLRDKAKKKR